MSADDGIYILKSDGPEWRVVHAQAIENIHWNKSTKHTDYSQFNDEALECYFGKSKVFLSEAEALANAEEIETSILKSDFPLIEYGTCIITLPRKFPKRSCKCNKPCKGCTCPDEE